MLLVAALLACCLGALALLLRFEIQPGDPPRESPGDGAPHLAAASSAADGKMQPPAILDRAREALAPATGSGSPSAVQADPSLVPCFEIDNQGERAICVADFLREAGELGPSLVGAEICDALRAGGDLRHVSSTLATCVREWSTRELFECLDRVQDACPRFETGDFIKFAMLEILATDPDVFRALRAEVIAESLYDADRTEMAVVLAAEIGLAVGDEEIRDLLVSGATGALGGTATQVDLSALVVVRLIDDPIGTMNLVDAVVQSPDLPPEVSGSSMGSSMIHILTLPSVRENHTEDELLAAIVSVLDHPLLGRSAAVHIQEQLQTPPPPISAAAWQQVLGHAEVIKRL